MQTNLIKCHCEGRSLEAISQFRDCFAIARNDNVRALIGFVLVVLVASILIGGDVFAAGKVIKGEGTLTAIESATGSDVTVIIDDRGYKIDPAATIINRNGKNVSLYKLLLPAKVYFEYEYKSKGFFIKKIVEFPEETAR